jgi:WS/DGAT/MGAT family acyltransferase
MSIQTAHADRADHRRKTAAARLNSLDLMFLRQENPAWPGHVGALALAEGSPLLNTSGKLRLQEIRERVNRRLAHVPQLRRRLHFPGPLRGKPLWVDDHHFDIQHHVHETAVEPPGGEPQLLDAAAGLYARLLDRGRPLWELWFLTGLSDGRVGVLLKLHHSVADGMTAVTIMSSLFDLEADAPEPIAEQWAPDPIPAGWSLLVGNFSNRVRTAGRATAKLAHPLRLARSTGIRIRVARQALGQNRAPRTSLNQVVRPGRRIRFLRLDLAAMKHVAHAHNGKINDVVLDLWSGGLRRLLLTRAEPTSGVELITNEPVSLRPANQAPTVANQVGFLTLPLPVGESDVQHRLDLIIHTTRKAKSEQKPAAMAGFLAVAAATPWIGKSYPMHQHTVNVKDTNVIGPPGPMYVLGARILDIMPITRLFGNVGLTLCAFSYAGRISLVVTADATAFPDLDVLMAGMEQDWQALAGNHQVFHATS